MYMHMEFIEGPRLQVFVDRVGSLIEL